MTERPKISQDEIRVKVRGPDQPDLVSEAKQDSELTAAIDMAKKFDPRLNRTLRVLTNSTHLTPLTPRPPPFKCPSREPA
jgi:hypothetical protein